MLSLTRGKEIAKFTSGRHKGDKLYLYGEHEFSKKLPAENQIKQENKFALIPKHFFNDNKVNKTEQKELRKLINEDAPLTSSSTDHIELLYDKAKNLIDGKLKKEVDFGDLKNTNLFPLPQKFSERIYVPAPSGSGKSTWISLYLKQLRLKNPNRKINILSRVPHDAPLDKFKNRNRITLTAEAFHNNPLKVEDFKNEIMIFDDIDTILDKDLVKYLRNFRDDVLEVGRHFGITCISTSHIITNHQATRTLLNEAQAVVLFPRGSSFYQIRNYLERYLGLTPNEIKTIRDIPSRWVYFWNEYPKYLIHEKGATIL
tara:strand:+ start:16126 stop:17070 length:945 start_codon:yes stop_codon:yes gene_type:complete